MSAKLTVISGQIRQLIALRESNGSEADLLVARPALDEAIKALRKRRREMSPIMDLEDAVHEEDGL
ncbi:MAG: hypothetical protein ACOYNN_17895 [Terrimicrobiaceae bacterium]